MLTLMAAFAESESEQKTSGRYKLVVQEGQAPRMGIIGNTLKCPERSEPLRFGHLRVFLIFPFIYEVF